MNDALDVAIFTLSGELEIYPTVAATAWPFFVLRQLMKAELIATDADTLIINALALRSVGQIVEALAQSLAAVDASDGREDAVLLAAEMMRQCGKVERAAAFLRAWIDERPSSGEWLASLGTTLRQLGRNSAAIASYEQALLVDPCCQSASSGLALLLIECGRPTYAANYLMQTAAVVEEPLYYLLGAATILAFSGFPDLAESFLVKADEMDPGNEEVKYMAAAIRKEVPQVQASPEYVRSLFDRHASSFDVNLHKLGYAGPEIVRKTVESLITDRATRLNVLDAGCGTGLCGPCLRPFAARLVGVDISTEMLRLAHGRACYDELVTLDLMDAESEFGPDFELIVCSDVLIYFGQLDRVLAVLRRCLRKKGFLILTVEKSSEVADSPGYEMQPTGRYKHAASYLRSTLLEVGFSDVPVMMEDVLRYENRVPVNSFTVVGVTN